MNYYNEWDRHAAAWLRELIKQGHIPNGVVDERSITEVSPEDLKGFTQCHFFSGVGGWSYALRLAGIPDDFPCWTGSPPCQPFSTAGKQLGQLDERHLAPTFMRLVDECKPAILFGEQVAAAIGKHWLDDLFNELERQGYACGSAVLPACSVGAPHKRDRLFFGAVSALANNLRTEWNRERLQRLEESNSAQRGGTAAEFTGCGDIDELADTSSSRYLRGESTKAEEGQQSGSEQARELSARLGGHTLPDFQSGAGMETVANSNCDRGKAGLSESIKWEERESGEHDDSCHKCYGGEVASTTSLSNPHNGFWSNPDWLGCRDGKFRPVESGTFPLANGIPARVGRLRGYGNAIVPQVAAEFIIGFLGASTEVSQKN